VRRHFVRRIAAFLAALVLLGLLGGGFLFWLGTRFGGSSPNAGHRYGPFGFIVVVVVVLGIVALIRGARRTAAPLGDVMDGAGRVAAGDYAARVTPRGPREVRQLGRSFNAMAERLEATERARRQLFAVRANVEGVLDGLYPADPAHLEPVLEETKVMSRLLDDLSTLAMAESGALRLHIEEADPVELADEVAAAHQPEAQAAGVNLAVDERWPGDAVRLDPVRIREVLSNLIANALRYTPTGGRITIAVQAGSTPAGPAVAFEVADTGPGIPADRQSTVFDRFSKSPDSRGAGLGLSIAKGLVEAHGGAISVASATGGTTFTFVLPTGGPRQGPDGWQTPVRPGPVA
jgi:two-component system sensor histidine kinase BaeS